MNRHLLRLNTLVLIASLILTTISFQAKAVTAAAQSSDAFQAALDAYNAAHNTDYAIVLAGEDGRLAYATAASGEAFFVMLGEDRGAAGWRVLVPGESPAAEYNRLLDAMPVQLIDAETRETLRLPEDPDGIRPAGLALANASGHKLPWPYGKDGYVTQKDTQYHMNQIDFDIQGLAASGDVIATKPGTVVFAKDSSSTTCQKPSPDPCWKKSNMVVIKHSSSEYSWYVHLAFHSVTVSVGQNVSYGTKIGVEGETGYSFGVHLHYMVSTAAPSTWPNPNDPDAAAWPTTASMVKVDFDEYTWANLIQTYSSTYRSQNAGNLPPVCPSVGGVLLYRNAQYACAGQLENSGYALRTSIGFQNVASGMNDAASSMRVPAGWSVRLYENADRGGGQKCINAPGDSDFSNDTFSSGVSLDNRVSSFEVFSEPDCPNIPPADLTAPGGSLNSPADGAAAGQVLQLSAAANDTGSEVQFARFTAAWGDQQQIVYTDTTAPYSYDWDLCAAGVPDGEIEVRLEIFDHAYNSLSLPPVQVTKSFNCAAASTLPVVGCTDDQWCGSFWNNTDLSGTAVLQRNEGESLLHEWGSAGPDPLLPADAFSSRYTRSAAFDCGQYRFTSATSDGVRLWIDDTPYIDQWSEPAQPDSYTADVDLTRGVHSLKLEHFDGSGPASLSLSWAKLSDCPAAVHIESVSTHYVRPLAEIEPAIRVRVTGGYLDPARDDHLAYTGTGSQSSLGAVSMQMVRIFTDTGGAYTFAPANDFRMTAPNIDGSFSSLWQVNAGGALLSPKATLQVVVDSRAPVISVTAPTGILRTNPITIQASASNVSSGVSHVQFFAGYQSTAGGAWSWHDLGYDTNGADGWSKAWDASAVPDQQRVAFFTQAWDRAGNGNGTWSPDLVMDRTAPTAAVTALAPTQDSTRFLVSWTASDNLSGLDHVDLRYQVDGGAWQDWLTNVKGAVRSAWFTGQLGHSYTFQIRGTDVAGNTGSYSADVSTQISPCSGDAYESDNAPGAANLLTLGKPVEIHTLCGTGDLDWYEFQAVGGKDYLFVTGGLGATTDTVLVLYASDGATMLGENNYPNSPLSALLWRPTQDQKVYVQIRHAEIQVAGNGVTYNLAVHETTPFYLPIINR